MPNGPNIIHEIFPNAREQFSINSGTEHYNRHAQSSGNILTTLLPPKEISSLEHAYPTEVAENWATNLGILQKDWNVPILEKDVSYNYRYTQLQENVSPKLVPTAHIASENNVEGEAVASVLV